jgi:hypothetical protein
MAVELGGQVSVHRLGRFPVPEDAKLSIKDVAPIAELLD